MKMPLIYEYAIFGLPPPPLQTNSATPKGYVPAIKPYADDPRHAKAKHKVNHLERPSIA